MIRLFPTVAAGLLALATLTAVVPASAQQRPDDSAYVGSTDYYRSMLIAYRDRIAKMTPEDRAKFSSMMDKLLQMEMDYKTGAMKMQASHEMEMAKMQRDLEMWMASGAH
jgi:hypothetical protein